VQGLLAIVFLAHGLMFLFPPESIVEQMNASLPRWFQLFLGVAEVAAAIGLTLPGLTGVMPALVPAAAAGIMIVMVGATVFHLMRAEWSSAVITFVLLLMASYVAYVRWRVAPFQARSGYATRA
jgi:uncharacterized membrane protein YphA (DoxX/SURF4 family)